MIPISLIVSLEIVKAVQGYMIELDHELEANDRKARCFSVSINEELG